MKYAIPEYIEKLPQEIKEYYSPDVFGDDTPYPTNENEANDYLLDFFFDVKNVKQLVYSNNKHVKTIDKADYYNAFNYPVWEKLNLQAKVTALYWFYEECCKELKMFPPHFYFAKTMPAPGIEAFYRPSDNSININCINVNTKSAFELLTSIAHELKHAQFDQTKFDNMMYEHNKKHYVEAPSPDLYVDDDPVRAFDYLWLYGLYHFQPTETEAYNYGNKKSQEVFLKNNAVLNANGKYELKTLANEVDIRFFKVRNSDVKNRIGIIKNCLGTTPKELLNMVYHLQEEQEYYNEVCAIYDGMISQKIDMVSYNDKTYTKKQMYSEIVKADRRLTTIEKNIENEKQKAYAEYLKRIEKEQTPEFEF